MVFIVGRDTILVSTSCALRFTPPLAGNCWDTGVWECVGTYLHVMETVTGISESVSRELLSHHLLITMLT